MKLLSDIQFRKVMKVVTICILLVLSFPILYSYITTIEIYQKADIEFDEGKVDLTAYDFDGVRPFELNGEWIAYEDIYLDGETVAYEQLQEESIVELPIRNLEEAKGTCTYLLYLKVEIGEAIDSAVISIPFATESIRVYVNGDYVEGEYPLQAWSGFDSTGRVYYLNDTYDSDLEYQEIIISTNEDKSHTDLYDRTISISTVENILGLEKMSNVLQFMLVAMMFVIVLIGVIYIIILPTYSVLTFINLFDTALMLHLFFNMSTLPQIVMDTVTFGTLGDTIFRQLDLAFLFLAGFLGNILANILYDYDQKYRKIFYWPVNISYLVMMCIFGFFPVEISNYGLVISMGVLIFSFVGIVVNFKRCIEQNRSTRYIVLHFLKTIWIGGIITADIVTINNTHRPEMGLIISYTMFFLVHAIVRAFEYRYPYQEIEKTNAKLEDMVEKRTADLIEANESLRLLSIKDALTKAYNRLYFEEEFIKNIEIYNEPTEKIIAIHICMLDMDNFKNINDTYGHHAGDEQLIEFICIVHKYVSEEVIVSRIGGEEFTLLFINYTDEFVLSKIEAIRKALEEQADVREDRTTGSFGVSKASRMENRKQLLRQADECLYYAKTNGKNQVVYDFNGIKEVYKEIEK